MPSAQLKAILADLDRHRHIVDLDRDNLGRTLHGLAVDVMLDAMDAEEDPDGNPWPSLSQDYADEKWKLVGPEPMAVLFGVMKTRENLEGEPTITPREASFIFGKDQQSRDEASWFQDPENGNQPARRFYALSAEAVRRITEFLDLHFARHTR